MCHLVFKQDHTLCSFWLKDWIFKAVQYAGKHQLCKWNLPFPPQGDWMSSTTFSMLVICSGCRGRAVTLSGTGGGRVGHTEIWILGSILEVRKTRMEGLILNIASSLQLLILKLQLKTQGLQRGKWRLSSFRQNLETRALNYSATSD